MTAADGFDEKLDAQAFAAGWLTTFLAAATDVETRLHRRLLVELYQPGLRLVATDGVVLLTTFVSFEGMSDAAAPGFDELPECSWTAYDADLRARELLRFTLKSTRRRDAPQFPLAASIEQGVPQEGQFASMVKSVLTIESPAGSTIGEAVSIDCTEETPVDWRQIVVAQRKASRTAELRLGAEVLRTLGAIPKTWPCSGVSLHPYDRGRIVEVRPTGVDGGAELFGIAAALSPQKSEVQQAAEAIVEALGPDGSMTISTGDKSVTVKGRRRRAVEDDSQ